MSRDRDFERKRAFGVAGEKWLGTYLLDRGVSIIPLYQFEKHDKAPIMFIPDGESLALPDFSCGKDGAAFFVESKRKTSWVQYPGNGGRGDGAIETGFNWRHFKAYQEVERRTGTPVWVAFLHEVQEPTGVFIQRLSVLKDHVRYWDGFNARNGRFVTVPEALFPLHALIRHGDYSDA